MGGTLESVRTVNGSIFINRVYSKISYRGYEAVLTKRSKRQTFKGIDVSIVSPFILFLCLSAH